jgi:hypothetical protein
MPCNAICSTIDSLASTNRERHRATDSGAGYLGGVSQIGFSHPTGTIEAPCVVATVCRGIDAEFCPLEFIGPICVLSASTCRFGCRLSRIWYIKLASPSTRRIACSTVAANW